VTTDAASFTVSNEVSCSPLIDIFLLRQLPLSLPLPLPFRPYHRHFSMFISSLIRLNTRYVSVASANDIGSHGMTDNGWAGTSLDGAVENE